MHSGCLFQKCHHSAQRWLLPGLASNKKRPYHTGFIMLGCMTVKLSVNAVVKLFPWNLVWGKKQKVLSERLSHQMLLRKYHSTLGKAEFEGDKRCGLRAHIILVSMAPALEFRCSASEKWQKWHLHSLWIFVRISECLMLPHTLLHQLGS